MADDYSEVYIDTSARGRVLVGVQSCPCGSRHLATWPMDAAELQCPVCLEMTATFQVAHTLATFTGSDLSEMIRSQLTAASLDRWQRYRRPHHGES